MKTKFLTDALVARLVEVHKLELEARYLDLDNVQQACVEQARELQKAIYKVAGSKFVKLIPIYEENFND